MTRQQEIKLRNALSVWFEVYDDECDADSLYHLRDTAERVSTGNYDDMWWLLNVNTKLEGKVNPNEVIQIMKEVGKKEYARINSLIEKYNY